MPTFHSSKHTAGVLHAVYCVSNVSSFGVTLRVASLTTSQGTNPAPVSVRANIPI
jgi:hypothetical protein